MGTRLWPAKGKMLRNLALISLLGCGLAGAGSIFYNGYQPYQNYGYVPASLGYNANYGYNGLAYRMPSYPSPAPAVPYSRASQFHAQDEFGNLQYGYNNLNSMKQETGNTYTGVTGAYSYVDPHGLLQRVEYVADGAGFRVADSRLPVFNPEPLVAPTFNPEPLVAPQDTKEVAEAKMAFQAAFEAAAKAAEEADH